MTDDIVERLRRQHDDINCLVQLSGQGFKSDTDREREYMEAGDLCWQAAYEIGRLRAENAKLRGICRTLVDSYMEDMGAYHLSELARARIEAAEALGDD